LARRGYRSINLRNVPGKTAGTVALQYHRYSSMGRPSIEPKLMIRVPAVGDIGAVSPSRSVDQPAVRGQACKWDVNQL
jgi:hypothetical protein